LFSGKLGFYIGFRKMRAVTIVPGLLLRSHLLFSHFIQPFGSTKTVKCVTRV
jgi:hypothetical protein